MGFLDELNTYTNKHIVPGVIDNVFKNDPLLAYFKVNEPQTFPGGSAIQENFMNYVTFHSNMEWKTSLN